MPVKAPIAAPVPVYNWSGVYLGLNGGYGFGSSNWTVPPGVCTGAACTTGDFKTGGFMAGGTAGASIQANALVMGIEADLDFSNVNGGSAPICGATETLNCQTSNTWLGTVRGRAGFAVDRILFFGTGGVAFGDVRANLSSTNLPEPAGEGTTTNRVTKAGWTAGGGVELRLYAELDR